MVARKVTARGSRSRGSSRKIRAISGRSTRPQATSSSSPEITASGSQLASGPTKTSSSSSTPEATTPDIGVRAPAAELTAERLNDPLAGIAEVSPAARLARPWPMNS